MSNSDVRYRHITLTGTLAPVALGGVVCGAPGNQLGPRVTSDGAHGAIVVWQDTRDTNYDIYGQRIHGGSYPVWAFDTLGVAISTATDNEYFPQVVPDGSGGAYMTWVNEFSFGNSDLFAQRVDQAGVLQWSPSLRLTQGTWTIGGGYPPFDTKTNSTGDLLVGWTQYQGGSPSGGDIRAQKVSPGGVLAWGTNGIGVGTGPESQVVQRIQPDATGGFAIVWKAERGAAADIYAQHLDTSGHKLWLHDGVRLATGSVPQEDNLYILPWGASEWAVMWRQQATESVYAARVNSVGEPIGPVYGTAVGAEVATLGSFTPVADGTGQVIFAYQTCCGMRPLNVNRLVLPSTGAPDVAQSFFVPQSGSVASPTEGQVAVRLMRVCPNNDGGSSLPNNVRVKVVLKDGAGAPLAGIDPADIFVALNGGTAAQGFYGAGADSIIANNAYNPTTDCPNLTMIVADAPTDANGVTYITFTGATPGSPGVGTRDPLRKWGHYDSELPVYALGRKLEGRLTSTSANGTYVLQIKNVDWTGGLGPALDQGEVVTVSDFNGISNGQGINNQISFWKDLNWLNGVDTIDRNIITAHFSDTGQHDCRTPNDP